MHARWAIRFRIFGFATVLVANLWPLQSPFAVAAASGTATEVVARHAESEKPRDPYMPGPGTPPPGYRPRLDAPTVGPHVSFQSNVDACGGNIAGDAANEPSIAVDPDAPNRIVIGWRQFDNVASDFRQNGWAYSRDGGRTWVFPGAVQPGQFRSDPVVAVDNNGTFYYMTLCIATQSPPSGFFTELFRSTEGGVTWLGPVPAFGGDKEWMAIDRSGGIGDGHITDTRATPSVTAWPTASGITYGQSLSASTLSGGTASVAGSFAFAAPGIIPNAGTYNASVAFTPTDLTSYKAVVGNVNGAVDQVPLTVTAKDDGKTYDGVAYTGGNGLT